MKMAAHDNTLETNAEVESQDFGIGDASVVIEILRNRLYEHKIRTCVQEYMCNARDAMREAKTKKRPIVSIPNQLTPVFKVRDFGPGITPDRMMHVFVKYGASTKRGTNGQTGGFGIGAKSAWAYTDSFTIVSVTDGRKRTYVAHLGVNNQGRLDKISDEETTEENGAEISIAVKPYDIAEFRNSAFRAAYFWKESEQPEWRGVTKLDTPEPYKPGLQLGKLDIQAAKLPDFLNFDSYSNRAILIVDGVPYPLNHKLQNDTNIRNLLAKAKPTILISVGNGVLEVGADREKIADSTYTRDALNKLGNELNEELVKYIKGEFKAVKSNADWIKTYQRLSNLVNVDEHSKYGDYHIERGSINSKLFSEVSITSTSSVFRKDKDGVKRDIGRFINIDRIDHIFYRDLDESMVMQNNRLRGYMAEAQRTSAILLDFKIIQPTLDDKGSPIKGTGVTEQESKDALAKIVKDFGARPLSSLKYTPPVRTPRDARQKEKEEFVLWMVNGYGNKHKRHRTLERIGKTEQYLYIPFKDFDKMRYVCAELVEFVESRGYEICAVTDKALDTIGKHKAFEPFTEWRENFKADVKLINAAKTLKAQNKASIEILARADEKIKDKHLVKMVSEYKGLGEKVKIPDSIMKIVSKEIVSFVEDDKKLTDLLTQSYPLVKTVTNMGQHFKKAEANELVAYINAKA